MRTRTPGGQAVARVAALTAPFLALAWAGNASLAASNVHDYPFNEPINVADVFGDMIALPVSEFLSAVAEPFFPLINEIMLLSFVMAVVAVGSRTINRVLLVVAAGTTIPYGLLGVLAGIGPRDGEWVGEGWAILACFTAWSAVLTVAAAVQFRGVLSPSQSAATA